MIKITAFLVVSEQVVLEIGKFVILWNIFEKERCGTHCTETTLLNLNLEYEPNKEWRDLANIFNQRASLLTCNIEQYVRTKLSLGHGAQHKEEIIRFIDSMGESYLTGGLLAIYRIRNNMFHGLKDYRDLDNQLELFCCINRVLKKLV